MWKNTDCVLYHKNRNIANQILTNNITAHSSYY